MNVTKKQNRAPQAWVQMSREVWQVGSRVKCLDMQRNAINMVDVWLVKQHGGDAATGSKEKQRVQGSRICSYDD